MWKGAKERKRIDTIVAINTVISPISFWHPMCFLLFLGLKRSLFIFILNNLIISLTTFPSCSGFPITEVQNFKEIPGGSHPEKLVSFLLLYRWLSTSDWTPSNHSKLRRTHSGATYNLDLKVQPRPLPHSHVTELQGFGNTSAFMVACSVQWVGQFCWKPAFTTKPCPWWMVDLLNDYRVDLLNGSVKVITLGWLCL